MSVWVPVCDDLWDSPAILSVPRTARVLHLEGLIYCAADGRGAGWIPRADLDAVTDDSRPEESAAHLVRAGIWEAHPAGWRIAEGYRDGGTP